MSGPARLDLIDFRRMAVRAAIRALAPGVSQARPLADPASRQSWSFAKANTRQRHTPRNDRRGRHRGVSRGADPPACHPATRCPSEAAAGRSTGQTSTACTGRRGEGGSVGPRPKRTTRSGRIDPMPRCSANCGLTAGTSIGGLRCAVRTPSADPCRDRRVARGRAARAARQHHRDGRSLRAQVTAGAARRALLAPLPERPEVSRVYT
jgi:hypothetical protein